MASHSYKLPAMSVPLTRVYRGTYLESVHRGSIAVVDSRGKLLADFDDVDSDDIPMAIDGCGVPRCPGTATAALCPSPTAG